MPLVILQYLYSLQIKGDSNKTKIIVVVIVNRRLVLLPEPRRRYTHTPPHGLTSIVRVILELIWIIGSFSQTGMSSDILGMLIISIDERPRLDNDYNAIIY
jgi:hypothetical protein